MFGKFSLNTAAVLGLWLSAASVPACKAWQDKSCDSLTYLPGERYRVTVVDAAPIRVVTKTCPDVEVGDRYDFTVAEDDIYSGTNDCERGAHPDHPLNILDSTLEGCRPSGGLAVKCSADGDGDAFFILSASPSAGTTVSGTLRISRLTEDLGYCEADWAVSVESLD